MGINPVNVKNLIWPVRFFTVNTKLAEIVVLASNDLTTAKKRGLIQEILTGLRVQCLTN